MPRTVTYRQSWLIEKRDHAAMLVARRAVVAHARLIALPLDLIPANDAA